MCLVISNRSCMPAVSQVELLSLYSKQRNAAIIHYLWQKEKYQVLKQLRSKRSPEILRPAYGQFELYSVQLVTAEAHRDSATQQLRRRLEDTNWRLERGPLFLECPEGNRGRSTNRLLLVRNQIDEYDQLLRNYAIIPREIAMTIKTREGRVSWAHAHFCDVAARPVTMIIGKDLHEIWPDRYGEIMFEHDRDVANRQRAMLVSECLWLEKKLRARIAFRFPLRVQTVPDIIESIATIGFSPFASALVA
jgi:hypothetical protein